MQPGQRAKQGAGFSGVRAGTKLKKGGPTPPFFTRAARLEANQGAAFPLDIQRQFPRCKAAMPSFSRPR